MIFVYDVADKDSLNDMKGYFGDAGRYTKRALKFIVANKSDLEQRIISTEEGNVRMIFFSHSPIFINQLK